MVGDVGADHDCRDALPLFDAVYQIIDFQAVHPRQIIVEQQQLWLTFVERRHNLLPIIEMYDPMWRVHRYHVFHDLAKDGMILYEEDGFLLFWAIYSWEFSLVLHENSPLNVFYLS